MYGLFAVIRKELALLEIGFENTNFQVFQGFPALKETVAQHPVKWPILDNFWPKWAKRDFFSKKRLEHFFHC